MTETTYKRKILLGIYGSREIKSITIIVGRKAAGRQASIALGQWLRVHILIHEPEAEGRLGKV